MAPEKERPRSKLSKTVIGLAWVSLLTDASSEIIFPLLPIFLTRDLHAAKTFLGVLEGAADATASLIKFFAGRATDRLARAKPLVLFGYSLSTVVRPLIALASAPWHVFVVRVFDRIGKGIRSAPRDAMIARSTEAGEKGRAFGFHQAMDHAGAAIGTLLGVILVALFSDLRTVFWFAAIPGFFALVTLSLVPEKRAIPPAPVLASSNVGSTTPLPSNLKKYLSVLFVFTLANSSDVFLILKAKEVGASDVLAPVLWLVVHAVKASLGTFGGMLSDRFGRVSVLASGWLFYGVCYAILGQVHSLTAVFVVTAVYGVYGALTDGAERALVSDLTPHDALGRGFGLYNAVNGIGLLGAGLMFGGLWDQRGSAFAFSVASGLASFAALMLWMLRTQLRATR